ncbi:MAG: hypothetical protein ACK5WD_01775 [bacterium]
MTEWTPSDTAARECVALRGPGACGRRAVRAAIGVKSIATSDPYRPS